MVLIVKNRLSNINERHCSSPWQNQLKNITEREEYQSIEETIKNNEGNNMSHATKQDFKKHMQVLYMVITTLTPMYLS